MYDKLIANKTYLKNILKKLNTFQVNFRILIKKNGNNKK